MIHLTIQMKSIQTKFLLLTVGCVLLSSLTIGGAGILSARQAAHEDSIRVMNLLCGNRAQELDALLSRIEQSVKTLAVYAEGRLDSADKLQTDAAYRENYTQKLESVAVNAATNTEGALAVYVRYNPSFAPPTSGLFWSKTALDGSFQRLTPTDFSRYSPEDVEHVGWYYVPVKSGKATWMAPYLNRNINVRMISYVIPIYRDNVTIGVVGMDIDFSIVENVVASTRVYDSGYAFLTDEAANVVYHGQLAAGTSLESADPGLRAVAGALRNGGGGALLSYRWRGESRKLAYTGLINGMRLAVAAPAAEIDSAQNRLMLLIGAFLALTLLLTTALTVLMTRRLIRPLRELNAAAQKIAQGDLSISLTRQTTDEVGMLADSFQQTVHHLQKYIDYINSLAYRDGLTGVRNKTAYQEAIARIEEQMRVGRPEFAVAVLDINGLKRVNDTRGHDFGDMLIIDACKIICRVFKHSPVYRIGGDEFAVILENGDYDHYQELLGHFERTVEEANRLSRQGCEISIARGVAVYDEENDLSFSGVFKRADDAMYQNKAAMKSRRAGSGEPAEPAR